MKLKRGLADLPQLGVGLGYRREISREISANKDSIDWLEVISEHYIGAPPEIISVACGLRKDFVIIPHGVEMSIGTTGEPDSAYLDKLAEFVNAIRAPWFSDHLCFTRAGAVALGSLTPLVRTRAVAGELGRKAQKIQDRVGVPLILENITYYFEFKSELSEAEFICEFLEHCDCGLLLDLTNVYINAVNHGFDRFRFLEQIPLERVVQVHVSGGEQSSEAFIDSHSTSVHAEVWELLRYVVAASRRLKGVLIERDQKFPTDFRDLLEDIYRAREILVSHGAQG